MHLIGRQPHELTDAELDEHLAQLRVVQTSAQTRKATIKKTPTAKKNFDHLFK